MNFTQAEAQYILNALDLQTKATGLATAGMALQIVGKLQDDLADQAAGEPQDPSPAPGEES